MNALLNIVLSFILALIYLYLSSKILNQNNIWKNIKFYIGVIVLYFVFTIFSNVSYEAIVFFLSLTFINFWVFPINILISIINSFLIFFLSSIIEIIIIFMTFLFKININNIGALLLNILIGIILYFLLKISFIKRIKNYLINNHNNKIFVFIVLIFIVLNIIDILLVRQDISLINVLICFILTNFLSMVLIVELLLEKINRQILENNNKNLNENLKNYEYLLNQQRIKNHENKNQLLAIKALVNNKDVNDYIDVLLNERYQDIDEKFLSEIYLIPFSGIKGFLYYKYIDAFKLGIKIKLEVGRSVGRLKEMQISTKELADLLKILGVFIDNAIQASEKTESKEIKINVLKNTKNELIITIVNQFIGVLDLTTKISGTTTKGSDHGYGLLLVEDILKRNKKITNQTEIISDVFIQHIIIKLD